MIDYYHNGLVITQILCLHFSGILMGKYSRFLLLSCDDSSLMINH